MSKLKVLMKPCSGGSCPALYQDDEGRIFIQGNKLIPSARGELAVPGHEEVVEISADLLGYLRSGQV